MEELRKRLIELKKCIYKAYPMTDTEFTYTSKGNELIAVTIKARYYIGGNESGYSRSFGVEDLQTKRQVIRAGEEIIKGIQTELYDYLTSI